MWACEQMSRFTNMHHASCTEFPWIAFGVWSSSSVNKIGSWDHEIVSDVWSFLLSAGEPHDHPTRKKLFVRTSYLLLLRNGKGVTLQHAFFKLQYKSNCISMLQAPDHINSSKEWNVLCDGCVIYLAYFRHLHCQQAVEYNRGFDFMRENWRRMEYRVPEFGRKYPPKIRREMRVMDLSAVSLVKVLFLSSSD